MEKSGWISSTASFLVSLSVIIFSGTTVSSQPQIVFQEETYEWGEVTEGDTVSHVFRFQNAGNKNLKIEKVSTS